MNRTQKSILVALVIGGLGVLTLRAQAQFGPETPAAAKAPEGAKFQVIPFSHNSAIMVDLLNGKSWKLEKSADKTGFVWVPVRRLDSDMEVEEWKQQTEKAKAEKRAKREARVDEDVPFEIEPFGFADGFEAAP